MVRVLLVTILFAGWLSATPAHGYIKATKLGTVSSPSPPPALVAARPPQLAAVPGTPVYYARNVSFNVFVYSGRYYSLHRGAWFTTSNPGAPWTAVATELVPRPLLAVPAKYYKVPPGQAGQAKKVAGAPSGKSPARGKKSKN